jgi:hypothetical protein
MREPQSRYGHVKQKDIYSCQVSNPDSFVVQLVEEQYERGVGGIAEEGKTVDEKINTGMKRNLISRRIRKINRKKNEEEQEKKAWMQETRNKEKNVRGRSKKRTDECLKKTNQNHSSVIIATRLADRGTGVRFSARVRYISFHHSVQTGSVAHTAFYSMGTGALPQDVKRPGREAEHLPPYSADINNFCRYSSTPPYVFMAWCSVNKRTDNVTFTNPYKR